MSGQAKLTAEVEPKKKSSRVFRKLSILRQSLRSTHKNSSKDLSGNVSKLELGVKSKTMNSFEESSVEFKQADDEEITLDNVLDDKLQEPFTKENFRLFLKTKYAEENVEFYESVKELKTVEPENSNLENEGEAQSLKENEFSKRKRATEIAETFIDMEAPKVLNISSHLRDQTIEKLNQSLKNNIADIGDAFEDAVGEVKGLLEQEHFKSFVDIAKTHNLSLTHARWRIQLGGFFFLTSFILLITLISLQVSLDNEILESPLLRLALFPSIFLGFFETISGMYCFCPFFGFKSIYMNPVEPVNWKYILLGYKTKSATEKCS